MEAMTGTANAAAVAPTLLEASRRDRVHKGPGRGTSFCSNPAFSSLSKAIHNICSSVGAFAFFFSRGTISATVLFPSHRFQTSAALSLRQCALFVALSYTRNSHSCRTIVSLRFGTKADLSGVFLTLDS